MRDGSVLVLDLPEGEFQFIAVASCGGDLRDTLFIPVSESECLVVEVFKSLVEHILQSK